MCGDTIQLLLIFPRWYSCLLFVHSLEILRTEHSFLVLQSKRVVWELLVTERHQVENLNQPQWPKKRWKNMASGEFGANHRWAHVPRAYFRDVHQNEMCVHFMRHWNWLSCVPSNRCHQESWVGKWLQILMCCMFYRISVSCSWFMALEIIYGQNGEITSVAMAAMHSFTKPIIGTIPNSIVLNSCQVIIHTLSPSHSLVEMCSIVVVP